MKIYIAGKYTGLGHEAACLKFDATEKQLIYAGIAPHDIVNPMKLGIPENEEWKTAVDTCKAEMIRLGCTAIFVQADWKTSFGAKQEINHALRNGITPYWEDMGDIENLKIDYHNRRDQSLYQVFTSTLTF